MNVECEEWTRFILYDTVESRVYVPFEDFEQVSKAYQVGILETYLLKLSNGTIKYLPYMQCFKHYIDVVNQVMPSQQELAQLKLSGKDVNLFDYFKDINEDFRWEVWRDKYNENVRVKWYSNDMLYLFFGKRQGVISFNFVQENKPCDYVLVEILNGLDNDIAVAPDLDREVHLCDVVQLVYGFTINELLYYCKKVKGFAGVGFLKKSVTVTVQRGFGDYYIDAECNHILIKTYSGKLKLAMMHSKTCLEVKGVVPLQKRVSEYTEEDFNIFDLKNVKNMQDIVWLDEKYL
jgi:hypothetical protein